MTVLNAEFTDNLDSGNTFKVEIPLTDARLVDVIPGRVWEHYREGEGLVFVGEIESVLKDETRGVAIVSGPTALGSLLYQTTYRERQFVNKQLQIILNALLQNTGWSHDSVDTTLVTIEFRGIPKLRAIVDIMRQTGNHFRETVTKPAGVVLKELTSGAFGVSSGVVVSGGNPDPIVIDDANLALIERITVNDVSDDVWNWLEPLGGGVGRSQLTLEHSGRSTPYTILPACMVQYVDFVSYYIADLTAFDSFQRTTLGNAPTGQTWDPSVGSWTITQFPNYANAHARCNSLSGGFGIMTLPCGVSDCLLGVEFNQWGGSGRISGLVFRYSDTDNYWRATMDSGGTVLTLTKRDGGVETTDTAVGLSPAAAEDRFEVVLSGNDITVRFRGTPVLSKNDSFNSAATIHGVYTEHTNVRVDNFLCAGPDTSIYQYGLRQRTAEAKGITLLSTAGPATTMVRAANALYDVASEYLDRNKGKRTRYTFTARGLPPSVRAGDSVRLRYKGLAERDDQTVMYLDVDTDVYVLSRRRMLKADGTSEDQLTVGNILEAVSSSDASALTAVDDAAQAFKVSPQLTVNNNSVRIYEPLDDCDFVGGGNPVDFILRIEDNVAQILRCNVRLIPRAIRSTAVGAESGGAVTSSGGSSHTHTTPNHSHPLDGVTAIAAGTPSGGGDTSGDESGHAHLWAVYINNSPGAFTERKFRDVDAINEFNLESQSDVSMQTGGSVSVHSHSTPAHTHPNHNHGFAGETTDSGGADTSGADTAHTHTGGAHTHNQTYGIYEGTTATAIRIEIGGADVTAALGGPWSTSRTFDITSYLKDAQGIVVQGDHQIRFAQGTADGGAIEAWFDMITLVAPIPI